MGPSIAEVMAAIAAQGIAPTGPVFSHHLRMDPDTFDFEVGVPVMAPVSATGRVKASQLPAGTPAPPGYHGAVRGLGSARGGVLGRLHPEGPQTAPGLWERSLPGPKSNRAPAT